MSRWQVLSGQILLKWSKLTDIESHVLATFRDRDELLFDNDGISIRGYMHDDNHSKLMNKHVRARLNPGADFHTPLHQVTLFSFVLLQSLMPKNPPAGYHLTGFAPYEDPQIKELERKLAIQDAKLLTLSASYEEQRATFGLHDDENSMRMAEQDARIAELTKRLAELAKPTENLSKKRPRDSPEEQEDGDKRKSRSIKRPCKE